MQALCGGIADGPYQGREGHRRTTGVPQRTHREIRGKAPQAVPRGYHQT